jgi:hypothetical protein
MQHYGHRMEPDDGDDEEGDKHLIQGRIPNPTHRSSFQGGKSPAVEWVLTKNETGAPGRHSASMPTAGPSSLIKVGLE